MVVSHLNITIIVLSAIDVILEPYFLFLVIRKSSPGMKIIRVFLLIISVSNFIFSMSFFITSPVMYLSNSYLFIVSSTLASVYGWFMWNFSAFCLSFQMQLSLLMLMYASYELTNPLTDLNTNSIRLWIFVVIFLLTPPVAYIGCNFVAFVNYESYNYSPKSSGLAPIAFVCCYGSSYSVLASVLIMKIRRISTKSPGQISTTTIKLVNNVVKNFLLSNGSVNVCISFPVMLAVVFSLLSMPNASTLMFGITLNTMAAYTTISTIASIFIFAPYRAYTLTLLRRISRMKPKQQQTVSELQISSVRVDSRAGGVIETKHK
ncbi:hypothetical protein L596_020212 [Steinernema carpocapsae]|uniref:G-protein coupled receptors family 1 profile domain-containing protein n=1 Tax=Steinernema carpocapsae TaxID=34508 RepID=A0A4U5MSU9_STECR|nr:hypothetical protein L596_020212 [Steinernema carpocapsae]